MMPLGSFGGGIQFPRPVSRVQPPTSFDPPSGGVPSPVRQPVGPYQGAPLGSPDPLRPIGPARPVLGMFHKGGKVPKTAAYLLKKGEHVVPAGKRKMTNRKPQKMVSLDALKG
jgi:hypothetical protein